MNPTRAFFKPSPKFQLFDTTRYKKVKEYVPVDFKLTKTIDFFKPDMPFLIEIEGDWHPGTMLYARNNPSHRLIIEERIEYDFLEAVGIYSVKYFEQYGRSMYLPLEYKKAGTVYHFGGATQRITEPVSGPATAYPPIAGYENPPEKNIPIEDQIDHWEMYQIGKSYVAIPVPVRKGPDYKEPTRADIEAMFAAFSLHSNNCGL